MSNFRNFTRKDTDSNRNHTDRERNRESDIKHAYSYNNSNRDRSSRRSRSPVRNDDRDAERKIRENLIRKSEALKGSTISSSSSDRNRKRPADLRETYPNMEDSNDASGGKRVQWGEVDYRERISKPPKVLESFSKVPPSGGNSYIDFSSDDPIDQNSDAKVKIKINTNPNDKTDSGGLNLSVPVINDHISGDNILHNQAVVHTIIGNFSPSSNPECDLCIMNCPESWNHKDLLNHFKEFGQIVCVYKAENKGTGHGLGFIAFKNKYDAKLAMSKCNGQEVSHNGQEFTLRVALKKPRSEKDKQNAAKDKENERFVPNSNYRPERIHKKVEENFRKKSAPYQWKEDPRKKEHVKKAMEVGENDLPYKFGNFNESEIPECNIAVFNMPIEWTHMDLYNKFRLLGPIISIRKIENQNVGFIAYKYPEDAARAIDACQNLPQMKVNGVQLNAKIKIPKNQDPRIKFDDPKQPKPAMKGAADISKNLDKIGLPDCFKKFNDTDFGEGGAKLPSINDQSAIDKLISEQKDKSNQQENEIDVPNEPKKGGYESIAHTNVYGKHHLKHNVLCNLFFHNIPRKWTHDDLRELAGQYGEILRCKKEDRSGNHEINYGWVVFASEINAIECKENLDEKEIFDDRRHYTIRVEYAKNQTRGDGARKRNNESVNDEQRPSAVPFGNVGDIVKNDRGQITTGGFRNALQVKQWGEDNPTRPKADHVPHNEQDLTSIRQWLGVE